MKLRTTAQLINCSIEGKAFNIENPSTTELEFSAIDTGGGYKDPLLDFSFELNASDSPEITESDNHTVSQKLKDPRSGDEITFSCKGAVNVTDSGALEINGRLKEDQLSEQLIGFVMNRLQ